MRISDGSADVCTTEIDGHSFTDRKTDTYIARASLMRSYYVYILANQRNGTLYVGVTNDLIRRTHEHREGSVAGFTKRYGVKRLVYFESWADVVGAIEREQRTKRLRRAWKGALL